MRLHNWGRDRLRSSGHRFRGWWFQLAGPTKATLLDWAIAVCIQGITRRPRSTDITQTTWKSHIYDNMRLRIHTANFTIFEIIYKHTFLLSQRQLLHTLPSPGTAQIQPLQGDCAADLRGVDIVPIRVPLNLLKFRYQSRLSIYLSHLVSKSFSSSRLYCTHVAFIWRFIKEHISNSPS